MQSIFKYVMPVTDRVTLKMPFGAVALSVQVQHGKVCLWALVDPNTRVMVARKFLIFGTGHTIADPPGRFLGTFQLNGGSLVFHVFEE